MTKNITEINDLLKLQNQETQRFIVDFETNGITSVQRVLIINQRLLRVFQQVFNILLYYTKLYSS